MTNGQHNQVCLEDHVYLFDEDLLLKSGKTHSLSIPLSEVYSHLKFDFTPNDYFFLGEIDGKRTFALTSNKKVHEEHGFKMIPVKDLLKVTADSTSRLICQAKQLLHWHKSTLFSGCCGAQNLLSNKETAKICSLCEKVTYPNISPVVIVLITKGRHILLARSPHFPEGIYSTIAGFIDAGETCEDAIHREIQEEVGVKVDDISYITSQSWPFPSSLMLGYQAKYLEGEISIDNEEIQDAQWFDISQLPLLPPKTTIARQMIDTYVSHLLSNTLN